MVAEKTPYWVPPSRLPDNHISVQYGVISDKMRLFHHIHSNPKAVKMCSEKHIHELKFRERTETDPDSPYWGWEKFSPDGSSNRDFQFIYPAYFLMDMCFTYGSKIETETGRGRPVNLILIQ